MDDVLAWVKHRFQEQFCNDTLRSELYCKEYQRVDEFNAISHMIWHQLLQMFRLVILYSQTNINTKFSCNYLTKMFSLQKCINITKYISTLQCVKYIRTRKHFWCGLGKTHDMQDARLLMLNTGSVIIVT